VPPSKSLKVKRAQELFRDFTGHEPGYIDTYSIEPNDVAFKIGNVDGVMYTTVRDGKTEKYIHRFKAKSRPLLASSFDGSQLYILGGGYQFTDRGIVDT
jgi:hypothetical protein